MQIWALNCIINSLVLWVRAAAIATAPHLPDGRVYLLLREAHARVHVVVLAHHQLARKAEIIPRHLADAVALQVSDSIKVTRGKVFD